MAEPTEKGTDSAFEPADRIESLLAGFVVFIQHFLYTLRDLAFKQSQFSAVIRSQPAETPYAKPITFITLISFLAIRIFRFGMLTILLSLGVTGCEAETWTEANYPSLLDELRIPTFTEFLWYGIPTLILALLLAQILKFVLLKSRSGSGKLLVTTIYYLVGFEYVAYLVLFAIASLLVYLETKLGRTFPPAVLNSLLLIFTFWILFVFIRLVSKTIDENQLRVRKRGWRQIWLLLWMFLLMAVTTLAGGGMAFSLAQEELEERRAKPVLSMNLIGFDPPQVDRISVNLLVRNNSKEEVALISNGVKVYGEFLHLGEITKSCLGQAPVLILGSNEVCWLTISFESTGTPYTLPSNSPKLENIVQFKSFDPAGAADTVSAYIRLGPEIYEISQIE